MIVYMLLISVTNVLSNSEKIKCYYHEKGKYFGANCSESSLKEIPQYLNTEIQFLDLSGNLLKQLNEDSFSRYASLHELYLNVNRISKDVHMNTFSPLIKLLILDLSDNFLNTIPLLPNTLERLYLDKNDDLFSNVKEIKFPSLKSLTFLSLRQNEFKIFPKLASSGPSLTELDLRENNIDRFSPFDVAPLCQLKTLRLSSEKLFKKTDQFCECNITKSWLNEYNVEVDNFNCRGESKYYCDETHISEVVKMRSKCMSTLVFRTFLNKYVYAIGGGAVLIIILFVILCIWKRQRLKTSVALSTKNNYELKRLEETKHTAV